MDRLLSDEMHRLLMRQPGWQATLQERVDHWPPAQRERLAVSITAGVLDVWRGRGGSTRDTEHRKRVLARAGAWDLDRDRLTTGWLQEQLYGWLVENLTTTAIVAHATDELQRLVDRQLAQDTERGPDITP